MESLKQGYQNNLRFPDFHQKKSITRIITGEISALSSGSYGSTLYEFRLGKTLSPVINAARNIVHPAHDSAHNGPVVPMDMGDLRPAPVETQIAVRTDQGYVLRHSEIVLGKVMVSRMELKSLIHDQCGGRCHPEQGIEQFMKSFGGLFPLRQIVITYRNSALSHGFQKSACRS